MQIIIREDDEVLSTVHSYGILPAVGNTITTKQGTFEIHEVAIDFVAHEITCYTREGNYDLSD